MALPNWPRHGADMPVNRLPPAQEMIEVTPRTIRSSAVRFAADSPLEESGFEPLVPLATEMLIELARGITDATRMLAVGDIGPVLRLCWPNTQRAALVSNAAMGPEPPGSQSSASQLYTVLPCLPPALSCHLSRRGVD